MEAVCTVPTDSAAVLGSHSRSHGHIRHGVPSAKPLALLLPGVDTADRDARLLGWWDWTGSAPGDVGIREATVRRAGPEAPCLQSRPHGAVPLNPALGAKVGLGGQESPLSSAS